MKKIISLKIVCICIAVFSFVYADGEDGWQTLHIKNHPKAGELDFSIQHSPHWKVSEGNRPHIVKSLTNGSRMFTIYVNKAFPCALSEEEADHLYTQETIKECIPKDVRFISARKTKLEGQTAWVIFYSMQRERLGKSLTIMVITCILVYREYMLQLQSGFFMSPLELSSIQTSPEMQAKYKNYTLETIRMFNTLVINNRYQ